MCYIRNQQKLPIDALDVDLGKLVSRCDERVRVKLFVGKLVRRHERRAGRLDHRGIAAGIDLVIGKVGKVLGNRLMDVPSPPGHDGSGLDSTGTNRNHRSLASYFRARSAI